MKLFGKIREICIRTNCTRIDAVWIVMRCLRINVSASNPMSIFFFSVLASPEFRFIWGQFSGSVGLWKRLRQSHSDPQLWIYQPEQVFRPNETAFRDIHIATTIQLNSPRSFETVDWLDRLQQFRQTKTFYLLSFGVSLSCLLLLFRPDTQNTYRKRVQFSQQWSMFVIIQFV